MRRLTIDQNASAKHTQQKGVEYLVLRLNDQRIIEDGQIQELGQELYHSIDDNCRTNFCLDFSNVDFFASPAFGKLITATKKLKIRGNNALGLKNIRPEIYEVFAIIKLDKWFDIDEASKKSYEESCQRGDRIVS